ncbi:GGDEF domain-containing protein [Varunaivibrio sulfuroxidans]|uniref:diguanylate cyclase n=1 Tax=Varunaivibrio sulfuroxidans TaxID=1773489 RepID=A0A4R3J678_9PROT|nr:GGDEF domain-containing protein [Varunaivibrio sulfuroxidans]TCS60363.1 diguanylate cyclase (GGDEF)-like protein [Varunaivibrio sulfuroxidans]WES30949.1 GGDEF domain-containing protein [Varunaivibrio sulfuroxidans]
MQSLKKDYTAFKTADQGVPRRAVTPGVAFARKDGNSRDALSDLSNPSACEEPIDGLALGNLSLAAVLLEDEVRSASWMLGEEATMHCIKAAQNVLKAALQQERILAQQTARIGELEKAVDTDILTGLLNRRGFEAELSRILSSARRFDEEGVLVYIDLDAFKPVNDTYGHAAGDEVLRRVGAILRKNVRETDSIGRVGGDEFAVVLTRTDHQNGIRCAKGLDTLLNTAHITWQGQEIPLRASLGYQVYGPHDDGAELLHRADTEMYRCKRSRAGCDNATTGFVTTLVR